MNDEEGSDTHHLRFGFTLNIKHPSLDAPKISDALSIAAAREWSVNEQRKTPKGRALPGRYKETSWGHSVLVHGKRNFFDEILGLVTTLETNVHFLDELCATGGSINIDLRLPGDVNIGDGISFVDLGRLSRLKINLSIEVFPSFS